MPPGLGASLDKSEIYQQMSHTQPSYFHLHLISDATGETLTTIAKAAAVQYAQIRPIEHVHPLVRTQRQLDRAIQEIEATPGIVLYTVVNEALQTALPRAKRALPACPGADHEGVRKLSRHGQDPDRRRPARA